MKLNYIYFLIILTACNNYKSEKKIENHNITSELNIITKPKKINEILIIPGFKRINYDTNNFGHWLQNISLKASNIVYLFNKKEKANQNAQFAIIDMSVGNKDLQQCADAVMRLRAEFLYSQKRYSEILFIDNENVKYQFSIPYSRENFDKYLSRVFGMCGTASLTKQLKLKDDIKKINSGDVFIKGGFPGHAVIVMDVIENKKGERKYMLAQSYMPAQDIHILKNPTSKNSPWFDAIEKEEIVTPEWVFYKNQLKNW